MQIQHLAFLSQLAEGVCCLNSTAGSPDGKHVLGLLISNAGKQPPADVNSAADAQQLVWLLDSFSALTQQPEPQVSQLCAYLTSRCQAEQSQRNESCFQIDFHDFVSVLHSLA